MKKIMNKINFAIIGVMASVPAFAAGDNGLCAAITKLGGIFKLLRTLAFIGAAFYIAQWAWDYIAKGDVEMKDIKNKGTGLLVGFSLLFMVGVILSFVLSASGAKILCGEEIINFGN